jgi:hypothetical protein
VQLQEFGVQVQEVCIFLHFLSVGEGVQRSARFLSEFIKGQIRHALLHAQMSSDEPSDEPTEEQKQAAKVLIDATLAPFIAQALQAEQAGNANQVEDIRTNAIDITFNQVNPSFDFITRQNLSQKWNGEWRAAHTRASAPEQTETPAPSTTPKNEPDYVKAMRGELAKLKAEKKKKEKKSDNSPEPEGNTPPPPLTPEPDDTDFPSGTAVERLTRTLEADFDCVTQNVFMDSYRRALFYAWKAKYQWDGQLGEFLVQCLPGDQRVLTLIDGTYAWTPIRQLKVGEFVLSYDLEPILFFPANYSAVVLWEEGCVSSRS